MDGALESGDLADAEAPGLLDDFPDALIVVTPDGRIQVWSRGAERLFGYTRAETRGRRLTDVLMAGDDAAELEAWSRATTADGGSVYESVRRRKDGTTVVVDVSVRAVRGPDGAVTHLAIVKKDVTRLRYLREAEVLKTRFKGLLDAAPDAMVIVNRDGRIVLANAPAERLFQYTQGELVGEPIELLVPERFRAEHPARRTDYFSAPQPRPMGSGADLAGRRRDGSEFAAEISLIPIKTEEGALFVTAAIRDVSGRRRIEDRFKGLLEAAPDAMVIVARSGRIVLVNGQTERLFGYRRDELIGQLVDLLVPEWRRERHPEQRSSYFADPRPRAMGQGADLAARRKDGSEFLAEISLSPVETEDELLVTAAIRDVSARRKIEEAVVWQAQLLDLANSAIMARDRDDRITYWNHGAELFYGIPRAQALGRVVHTLLKTEFPAPLPEIIALCERTGRWDGILIHEHRDGRRVTVASRWALQRDAAGQRVAILELNSDISEQKRLEVELRKKNDELEAQNRRVHEATRLKSEFLANMSHELRTPLNAIIGFAKLMHTGTVGPVSADHKEYLGDILASGNHLLQLINDVLDLSKVEAGKMDFRPEPVDLESLVHEIRLTLGSLAVQKRIRIAVAVAPELTAIVTDPARLKQILYNYLSNALKFTPDGGTVHVRARPEGRDRFRLEVEDPGIGIKAEDLGRLFVEFQQLDSGAAKKHQGTGLGLALTKRLAAGLGGEVGVRSAPGEGSTFFVVLPRVAPAEPVVAAAVAPTAAATTSDDATRATVLVVEDDANDRERLTRHLTSAGYLVETAARGAEALARSRERAFAAITLDLILPDMSGWDVLASIRSGGPNERTPVLVTTIVGEARAAFPVHDYLVKPIRARDLTSSLARAGIVPRVNRAVLVIDDEPANLRLAQVAIEQAGYRAVCRTNVGDALAGVAADPPAAVVLDLLLPGTDGFEFLAQFRATAAGRDVPVIVWTVKDLTTPEQNHLEVAAHAIIRKGDGGAEPILAELRRLLGGPAGR